MGMVHEHRLDNTVDGALLGFGEKVDVRTKMGALVTRGIVETPTPLGVVIREENGKATFFRSDFYLFAVEPVEVEEKVAKTIVDDAVDLSFDDKLAKKLAALGEGGDPVPAQTGAQELDPDMDVAKEREKEDEKKAGKEKKNREKDSKDKAGKEKDGKPDDKDDASIDVDQLPDDIKKAIVSTKEMDEVQVNGVLSDISDAAVKSLKRTSVKETEVYEIVDKIQDAVAKILTGKGKQKA